MGISILSLLANNSRTSIRCVMCQTTIDSTQSSRNVGIIGIPLPHHRCHGIFASSRSLLSTIRSQHQKAMSQTVIHGLKQKIPNELSPRFLQEDVCDRKQRVMAATDYLEQFLARCQSSLLLRSSVPDSYDFDAFLEENPRDTDTANIGRNPIVGG